jgi:hypothetical protein
MKKTFRMNCLTWFPSQWLKCLGHQFPRQATPTGFENALRRSRAINRPPLRGSLRPSNFAPSNKRPGLKPRRGGLFIARDLHRAFSNPVGVSCRRVLRTIRPTIRNGFLGVRTDRQFGQECPTLRSLLQQFPKQK